MLLQGGVQYGIVNGVLEPLFPGRSARNVISKILGMNLVADPFFFLPTFYVFKEAMLRKDLTTGTICNALTRYRANCFDDWRNTWTVWFPGHAVTYGLMPPAFRLPWMAVVSFGYVAVLSITRGEMATEPAVTQERKPSPELQRRHSHGLHSVGMRAMAAEHVDIGSEITPCVNERQREGAIRAAHRG